MIMLLLKIPSTSGLSTAVRTALAAGLLSFLHACSQSDTTQISLAVEKGLLPLTAEQRQLDVMSTLAQRMDYYQVPGVSIAVFKDGEIVWAEGYGVTHADAGDPVTSKTLFQAASISKSVTAIGALRLVQGGKLELDEDVNRWLTTWRIPENQFSLVNDVTLRLLLNHSAGVNVPRFPGYSTRSTLPSLVEVLDGAPPANTDPIQVDIPIGSEIRYSGGGYTIVQQLMIDISGQSFPDLMAQAVLGPMGMHQSTFEQPLPVSLIGEAASGHRPGIGPVEGSYHIYPEMAAAGLWTTASDLARFAIGIHRSLSGGESPVLNRLLTAEALTVHKRNYGLGFVLDGEGPARRFSHNGINEGYSSLLVAYPSSGSGAVVMTNSNLSAGLIKEIIDSIAKAQLWPDYPLQMQREIVPLSSEQLNQFEGEYDLGGGFVVTVIRKDDSLYLMDPTQGFTEIFSAPTDGQFFTTGLGLPPFTFMTDESSGVAKMRMLPPDRH